MIRNITTKNLTLFTLLIAGMSFLYSCEADPKAPEETAPVKQEKKTDDVKSENQKEKVPKIFYAIPSPVEMASLIKSSNSVYNKDLLNSIDNAKMYTDHKAQALNLGVYFSDITYASIFERTQESIVYLSTLKGLAEDLGIAAAVSTDIYDRLEANKENKDSLITIFSETYFNLNGFLKEEKREEIAAMIIAGGWIEGLYLAINQDPANEVVLTRIAEQKYTLQNLNSLINSYSSSKLDGIKKDLKDLTLIFDEVIVMKEKTNTKVNNGVMELDNKSKMKVSDETLVKITEKVTDIRNRYTQKK